MKYSHILIHYAEIGLKGKNRTIFEQQLVQNIRLALKDCQGVKEVRRLFGRIVVVMDGSQDHEIIKLCTERLQKVFGISSFSPTVVVKTDFDQIKDTALDLAQSTESDWQTFKVSTKRSHKLFPATSMEVSRDVGAYILERLSAQNPPLIPPWKGGKVKVNIKDPDLLIQIEITEKQTYVFTEKITGAGGLPVGSSGTVVSLLSGGIDSPVASWQLMKRGCPVVFVHFHSAPQTSQAAIEKVRELAQLLSKWQIKTKVYMVPFLDIQKEIVKECRGEYRVVLYRRFMYRIAAQIAEQEKAKALVTGESVGQVASQTIENIAAINDAVTIPILRPLIGLDKIEIIDRAKQIGTYELSILPHDDCCSLFVPRHPVTKSNIGIARIEEEKLDFQRLIRDAISNATKVALNSQGL